MNSTYTLTLSSLYPDILGGKKQLLISIEVEKFLTSKNVEVILSVKLYFNLWLLIT